MDAQTCLKKLEYVGVLNFATVGLDGTPQIRCVSAIHYEPDKLYFFTAKGKDFCRELLEAKKELGITMKIDVVDWSSFTPVSYTHLDVYKRQPVLNSSKGAAGEKR